MSDRGNGRTRRRRVLTCVCVCVCVCACAAWQTDSLWFGQKGKGMAALSKGSATNPPVDFELETIMKRFGHPFRHKMWTTLGIRSAEEILALRNMDFNNFGFSEFDRKLLRREAAKIVAQGDRSSRIRRRLVSAISGSVGGDASHFVKNLHGLFEAACGFDAKISSVQLFESLHQARLIDSALFRESAFLQAQPALEQVKLLKNSALYPVTKLIYT